MLSNLAKVLIVFSMAYYIIKLFNPLFFHEALQINLLKKHPKEMDEIISFNKEETQNEYEILSWVERNKIPLIKYIGLAFFLLLHMIIEFLLVINITFVTKDYIAILYITFWICLFIYRWKSPKLQNVEELIQKTYTIKNLKERVFTVIDALFFIYVFMTYIM